MKGWAAQSPQGRMLSRLFQVPSADKGRQDAHQQQSQHQRPFIEPHGYAQHAGHRYATADFTEADDDDEDESHEEGQAQGDDHDHDDDGDDGEEGEEDEEDENEDGLDHAPNILPLFSASHLDSLPVYSITHAIRIIVQARTETTLTWDQLRSPQVSQFLVKPMQQQIRTQHFSRATLYALMANCLQFTKEGQMYPGNAGTSSTRAKVCELLAIKMLKEYTIRELIDALSYDFYPLQGLPGSQTPMTPTGKPKPAASRTSTLEVAIRASAKHFLAHPLVVQQLEAIWNGAISFYSAADQLHREVPHPIPTVVLGSHHGRTNDERAPLLGNHQGKEDHVRFQIPSPGRRTVTLYNPRNASLLKLSRLRVPRYRQFFSTCSLAVLICLFLAVLIRRSSQITSLELVFWFWSAGFMLDELVGFNEQGFSLYIMSFWNIFDLGILLLLILYYCMRIWGVFLLDPHKWNENAYDVLAANAILLLPRIFSVLDHYQYFSQLLLAFRLMAIDLAAVFILVLISCSGFFVFFTLSKTPNQNEYGEVAYKIFQILMGFTPAAWEVWPEYNWLGRLLMGLFLIICHFVVVTILITVLTNSFMSIASNAREEHQFLFAINTISMVKNDALFSYIAPGNIFAWAFMPLRYCMPMKQFVALNRFVIKITHFPLLFCIFVYERFFLAPFMYEPTDLVEHSVGGRQRAISFADPASRAAIFSPNVRVREESVVGYQKDRALDELFRKAPDMPTLRTQRRNERRRTQNAIRTWMDQNDGGFPLSTYSTMDTRKSSLSRELPRRFRQFSDVRSAASDPADLLSLSAFPSGFGNFNDGIARRDHATESKENIENTDADGDDELVTNDEDDEDNATNTMESQKRGQGRLDEDEDYFTTPVGARFSSAELASAGSSTLPQSMASPRPSHRNTMHNRTLSTNTILYAPQEPPRPHSSSSASMLPGAPQPRSRPLSNRNTPVDTPTGGAGGTGRRSPRRSLYMASRARPIPPPSDMARTAPNRATLTLDIPPRKAPPRRRSSTDLDASSVLNAAMAADDTFGAVPSSFATQMAMATGMMPMVGKGSTADNNRMGRLMLAKMKTMEESLGDIVREIKVLRSAVPSTANNSGDDGSVKGRPLKMGSGSSGSAGPAMIEVAGRERLGHRRTKTATSRLGDSRPPSRKVSQKPAAYSGPEIGDDPSPIPTAATAVAKGKGKAVYVPTADADDSDDLMDESFTKKGSSL